MVVTGNLLAVAGLLRQTDLLCCPSFPLWAIRAPTSREGYGFESFVRLNVEPVCFTKHMLVASRFWWGMRKEVRGGLHMVPW